MKLIGISITPSMNLTDQRELEQLGRDTKGIDLGPLNSSNQRTRFHLAVTDPEAGYDFLETLAAKYHSVALIPALDVHR
jgi:hypothetical protein